MSVIVSDGVSDLFFGVSISKDFGLEGFRSRALRLETLHRLFLWNFARSSLKNGFKKYYCSKFNRSKRSVAKLPLLCYLQDGENNLPTTLFKIYTEFNKCACTYETAARNLCIERLGVFCKGLSLNCFSRSFVTKPIGLFKRGVKVSKCFFFEKQNFSQGLSKHSDKTRWWSFFCSA